jgi:hypothetical protein
MTPRSPVAIDKKRVDDLSWQCESFGFGRFVVAEDRWDNEDL